MGDQENCDPANRVSKKRAFASVTALSEQHSSHNKRAVLGELGVNTANIDLGSADFSTPVPILKKSVKKIVVKELEKEEIVVGSDEDLQKFGYSSLIYQYLHSLEVEERRRPLADYMDKVQKDVTVGMREILVDWLVEVAEEYKLVSDTLFLTISYIDRFLSSHALSRNKLQLLGVSCMLIASKHEEITPPHIQDFCYITDNTYTKEEVINMEKEILKFLNFEVSNPTTKTFLRSFTRTAQEKSMPSNLKFEFLACYLAELSLLDYKLVRFMPSMVAASAIFLSNFTIQPEKHPWSIALQRHSGYTAYELKDCVLALHDLQLCKKGNSSKAVREKYMQHKFKFVAELTSLSAIPQSYF